MKIKTPKEFLIEVSPNDSCGVREKLQKVRLRSVVESIMQKYADYYHQEKLKISGDSVHQIRNKLTPITHLISMVELGDEELIKKAIPIAKESVNVLADREVYDNHCEHYYVPIGEYNQLGQFICTNCGNKI